MRAERLIAVLMLLKKHERMTAAAIAGELEVSERTVLRDIEALSLSGVPVYAERGRNGGFALLSGYRTDLTGLTLDEAIALMSGNGRIESRAAASALRKLEAALPEMHRGRVAEASQRILVRPEGFVRSPQKLEGLSLVQEAVFAGRRIRVMYERRGGDPAERVLDPIGLIVAGDTWYLVANSSGTERMYRVSRMTEVVILDEVADRDAQVDLDAVWERHRTEFRSQFRPLDVVINCAADDVARIGGPITVVSIDEIAGSRRVRAVLRFGDGGRAVRVLWVTSFDVLFEVVEPDWVRDALRERATLVRASGWGR